jgi:hypothetical protein
MLGSPERNDKDGEGNPSMHGEDASLHSAQHNVAYNGSKCMIN